MDKYYQILGLDPGVSEEKIKQAYKDLVNVWHPDRFHNNPRLREKANEKLKEINFAYKTLKAYIAGKGEEYTASEEMRTHAKSQPPPYEPPPTPEEEQTTQTGDESYGGFQPPPEQPFGQTPAKSIYAGFWNRFAALFIDSVIIGIGGLIFYLPFLIAKGMSNVTSYPFWIVFDFILSTLIGWLYYTLLESSTRQATIGKMAVGIIVTDVNGDRISFGRANGRWWGKTISFLILGIGYIIAGFTKKKQALHDIMADTLVLKKSEKVNEWVTVLVIIIWSLSILGIVAAIAIPLYEKYRMEQTVRTIDNTQTASAPPSSPPTTSEPSKPTGIAKEPGLREADQFTDPLTGMEYFLVFVKGGKFEMGDTFGDGFPNEKPVHEVVVGDFHIGKFEVTQGQWQKVMGNNPSVFKSGDNYPVDNVSWNEVQQFIERLNEKTGKKYRLPTEAEWEYAARSGGKKEKWAGTSNETELREYASYTWYDGNSDGRTNPIGEKKPNGLGLYDMSGNVWQWCQDWYDEGYYRNSPREKPQGPTSGSHRAVRGGCQALPPRPAPASFRGRYPPTSRTNGLGFRLVLPSE